MLRATVIAGLAVLGSIGQAAAQSCPCASGQRLDPAQLAAAFSGKTVCAVVDGQMQQEYHSGQGSGPLVAYKRGPAHPIDPSETVGTWYVDRVGSVSNAAIHYIYGGSSSYAYEVCGAPAGPYTYCGVSGARNFSGITTRSGQVACSAAAAPAAARVPLPAKR